MTGNPIVAMKAHVTVWVCMDSLKAPFSGLSPTEAVYKAYHALHVLHADVIYEWTLGGNTDGKGLSGSARPGTESCCSAFTRS